MKRQHARRRATSRHLTILLVIAILVPLAGRSETGRAGLADMPYRLIPGMTSSVGTDQQSLAASDSLIVWEDHRTGSPDVYVYDLNDSREYRASTEDGIRRRPDVHASLIVWVSSEEHDQATIRGIDLAEGLEFAITDEPGIVDHPAVSSDIVAWQEKIDGRWVIQVADLNGEPIATLGEDAANAGRPSVSGARVVWQEHDGDSWNIRVYDTETSESLTVTEGPDNDQQPAIDGDQITFVRSPEHGGAPSIVVVSTGARAEQTIANGHFVQRPSLRDNLLVWEDWRSGLPDVYAFDLNEQASFAVARSQQANEPVVSEQVIAWISGNSPASQRVQALEIQNRLPTDPRDPPASPSPDRLYIPETQQFVSSGFKSYWQAHGGPRLLGYPLTDEFAEVDPETGDEIVVQYFERVKLEFHPNAPHDNRIRMARLGVDLRPDSETERSEPFENDDGRRYFETTGHGVQGSFFQFWESHGGVGVFGYPITGEFTENGRTVQYFERARFENDPESGGGRVQLGLLGREALQERGWLPPPPVDTTQIFE